MKKSIQTFIAFDRKALLITALMVAAAAVGYFGWGPIKAGAQAKYVYGQGLRETAATGDSPTAPTACSAQTFANPAAITINDAAPGSPYPSNISVAGVNGTVSKVTVTLNNFSHTYPGDVDVMLVGPGGQNAVIMSDAGGSSGASNVTFTLDDDAATGLSNSGGIAAGTFIPSDFPPGDGWPAPAPAPAGGSALSTFVGQTPNGTWSLYVVDDAGQDVGSFAGGWTLNITPSLCSYCSTGAAVGIPDNGYNGTLISMASKSIVVSDPGTISAVQVNSLAISHTWIGDLTIKLQHPDGTLITLLNRPGSNAPDTGLDSPTGDSSNIAPAVPISFATGAAVSGESMGNTIGDAQTVCQDDAACIYLPAPDTAAPGDLTTLIGKPAAGTWILYVGDSAEFDIGTLTDFCLQISTTSATPTSTGTATASPTPGSGFVNGSFETGDYTGWILSDLTMPYSPLTVRNAGDPALGFFTTAPSEGMFASVDGFDGNGPGNIRIAQDVLIPSGATLNFDFRAGWNNGGSQARTLNVIVQPAGGGAALLNVNILTAPEGTNNPDTGNQVASVDLSAFAGQTVRVIIDQFIPETFTGPGQMQIDNVRFAGPTTPTNTATPTATVAPTPPTSQLIPNGSFEKGDYTSWIVSDLTTPYSPLTVRNAGDPGVGFFTITPTEGMFASVDGFDGNGPGNIRIAQDIEILAGATLNFDYRAAWNNGGSQARTLNLIVQPAGGGADLLNVNILTAPGGTNNPDTGNQVASVNLSAFGGQTVRLIIDQFIPETFTGPAQMQIDNVRFVGGSTPTASPTPTNSATPSNTATPTATGTPEPMLLLDTVTSAKVFDSSSAATRSYMGNAWMNNTLPGGTESVEVTSFELTLNVTAEQSYNDLQVRVQFWNNYGSASSPVFDGAAGMVQTYSFGPQNLPPGTYGVGLGVVSPITLVGGPGTNWGFAVNWQGDTGGGLVDTPNLTTAISSNSMGTWGAGQITNGTAPTFGFYNAASRTDLNFNSADLETISGMPPPIGQAVAIKIYGNPVGAPASSISGTVTYGNSITANPPAPRFVKNVTVANSAGSPDVGFITGTDGTYILTGFGAGSYTILPKKPAGFNTAITSNDAARVAQGVSGSVPFVTLNQKFASDSSGNGNVTSNDAALIARFAAGLPGTGNVGQWKFFTADLPGPPTAPLPTPPYNDSRTYPMGVSGNITDEDYVALLIGEASGNYNPATHARPATRTLAGGQGPVISDDRVGQTPIIVTAQPVVTGAEREIVIPVSVEGVMGKDIISYEFNVRYDPAVMQPLENPVDVLGTVSSGLLVVTNPKEPGLLRVVVYGPVPIGSDGVLLNLAFMAVGKAGGVSPLTFERLMFNEGEFVTTVTNGKVELY